MNAQPTFRWRHLVTLLLLVACRGGKKEVLTIDRQVRLITPGDSASLRDSVIDSIVRIGDIVLHDSVLTLTDARARRFVQLVPGRFGRIQGRKGNGPGEFQFPLYTDAYGSQSVVGDAGNSRFQFYGTDGQLTRILKSPVSVHHFALESDSTLLVAIADSMWYLARVNMRGEWQPVARRPIRRQAQTGTVPTPRVRHDQLVAMLDKGSFVVFDQNDGVLRQYDTAGNLSRERHLPPDILQRLLQARDEDMSALGGSFGGFLSAPIVKDLSGDRRGHLLMLMSARPVGALWIDFNQNRVVALTSNGEVRGDPLLSASVASVSGDTVAISAFDGSVRIRRIPPSE